MLTRVKMNAKFDLLLYMTKDSKRCEFDGVTRVLVLSCQNLKRRPDPGLAVLCPNVKGWPGFWLFSVKMRRGDMDSGCFCLKVVGGDPGSCYLQHHPLPVTNISVSRGRGWVGGVSLGGWKSKGGALRKPPTVSQVGKCALKLPKNIDAWDFLPSEPILIHLEQSCIG